MKKQTFKYYYLANTLIPGKHDVLIYDMNNKLLGKWFDEDYMKIRYELYEQDVYDILVKEDTIKITLKVKDQENG